MRPEPIGDERSTGPTVLFAGSGAPCAAPASRALRSASAFDPHIVGTDHVAPETDQGEVDTFVEVPSPETDEFVPELVAVADRADVDLVYPLRRPELHAVAAARPILADRGIVAMVPPLNVVEQLTDTHTLYGELAKWGTETVPDYYHVETVNELWDAAHQLGYPDRSVRVVWDDESRPSTELLVDPTVDTLQSPIADGGTTPSVATPLAPVSSALESYQTVPDVCVTEPLPGPRFTADVVAAEESIAVSVPQRWDSETDGRVLQPDAITGETLRQTVCDLSARFDLEHNLEVHFRANASGEPKLVGVKPRLTDAVGPSFRADVNTPAAGVVCSLRTHLDRPMDDWEPEVAERFRGVDCEGAGNGSDTRPSRPNRTA